ncbi:MAG TPA: hypothetical protein VN455_02875, partial [Methanotrichaceae archaeon]|nr:hypothetical protein [Methanotrichaceae archaeon]
NSTMKVVGPAYSSSGTSNDATGSYLTAKNIAGTSLHDINGVFTYPPSTLSTDIDEVNIWSWIDGSDPRTHVESAYGLTPYVATPNYAAYPAMTAAGVTTGPKLIGSTTATTRSVDVVFISWIEYLLRQ